VRGAWQMEDGGGLVGCAATLHREGLLAHTWTGRRSRVPQRLTTFRGLVVARPERLELTTVPNSHQAYGIYGWRGMIVVCSQLQSAERPLNPLPHHLSFPLQMSYSRAEDLSHCAIDAVFVLSDK
jgi:hypothetical protein